MPTASWSTLRAVISLVHFVCEDGTMPWLCPIVVIVIGFGILPPNFLPGRTMFDLSAIQSAWREFGFDGWLLYDFRGLNVLARRILGVDQGPTGTRRFFYFI